MTRSEIQNQINALLPKAETGEQWAEICRLEALIVTSITAENRKLRSALDVAESYFDDRSDVVDGDYGVPAPNAEMSVLSEIRDALL